MKITRVFLCILLSALLALSGCSSAVTQQSNSNDTNETASSDVAGFPWGQDADFKSLGDEDFLQYMQDGVYEDLEAKFSDEDYTVENVSTAYVSKEYIEELSYNSKANIYFGYTLSELENMFQGTKYVFSVGDDGETTVKAFEAYDDTYDQIVRNVAIGSGVILVCVTVTVATGGTAAPICAVFAASAKSAVIGAASGAVISAAASGIATGIETGDVEQSVKAAALSGSEGFAYGAIFGAATGGISEAVQIARTIPTPRESELEALRRLGGEEQVAFLNGEKVASTTAGSTRPDVLFTENGKQIAAEVKNYNLVTNLSGLKSELERQVSQRVKDLPEGMLQRVLLDVRGRGYSSEFVDSVIAELKNDLARIDPNISIEAMTLKWT